MTSPKFGISKDIYEFNKEKNIIAKGVGSIKYLNKDIGEKLFRLSQTKEYNSFMELLLDLKSIGIDTRQTNILISIGYFSNFGNTRELSQIFNLFDKYKQGDAKKISKDKISPKEEEIIKNFASCVGANGNELKSYTINDMTGLLCGMEDYIKSLSLPDTDIKVRIANSLEYLGYVDISTGMPEDRKKLLIEDLTPISSGGKEPWCYRINTMSLGSGKKSRLTVRQKQFSISPIKKGDIIFADEIFKNKKGFWEISKYHLV